MSAVNSYDIDADIDGASIAFVTTGSTEHSRIRGRLRNVTNVWGKSGSDTLTDFRVESGTALGFTTRELTIASGAITVYADWHYVDTESDAATDDLDTINGGWEGREVTLFSSTGTRDPVLKHATGNIRTPNGGDITISSGDQPVKLIFRGSNWYVVSGRPDVVTATGAQTLYSKTLEAPTLTRVVTQSAYTAPSTAPADVSQIWVEDAAGVAGKSALHLMNEAGTEKLIVGGVIYKTTTGDPSEVQEGLFAINTSDNTVKVYADGAWRTIASGW
jgi:hypothetical protein